MKRIISLFIIFTLSVAFVGCSNNNKNYTSEELAQNLRLIKNNKNDSDGVGGMCLMKTLGTVIINGI